MSDMLHPSGYSFIWCKLRFTLEVNLNFISQTPNEIDIGFVQSLLWLTDRHDGGSWCYLLGKLYDGSLYKEYWCVICEHYETTFSNPSTGMYIFLLIDSNFTKICSYWFNQQK